MKRLADYIVDLKSLPREAFMSAHATPVLLHRPDEDADEGFRTFKTGVTDPGATRFEMTVGLNTDPDLLVIPVEKRPGGVFNERVSVGRTRNNDVQLPYPKVSKFHAYFSWTSDGSEYHLTDADSTNGTYVNGHRLDPKAPVVVPDRCIVSFGRYHFRFHMAAGLYRILEQLVYGTE